MSKFRVEIDKNACQGFGACVELCPKLFQLSDIDQKSSFATKRAKRVNEGDKVVGEILEPGELECLREAAEAYPFAAIHNVNLERRGETCRARGVDYDCK